MKDRDIEKKERNGDLCERERWDTSRKRDYNGGCEERGARTCLIVSSFLSEPKFCFKQA